MNIIGILIALILLGFLLWLVNVIPMDATIKKIITAAAIVLVVIWIILQIAPLVVPALTIHR
jgi:hypothetical protein